MELQSNPILSSQECSSFYGAPRGRKDQEGSGTGMVILAVLPIDGDYDPSGVYWGSPQDLYVLRSVEDESEYWVRAKSPAHLRKEHPNLDFHLEIGYYPDIRQVAKCLGLTDPSLEQAEILETSLYEVWKASIGIEEPEDIFRLSVQSCRERLGITPDEFSPFEDRGFVLRDYLMVILEDKEDIDGGNLFLDRPRFTSLRDWCEGYNFESWFDGDYLLQCRKDLGSFLNQAEEKGLLEPALEVQSEADILCDFWLTRQGHGVGFWDGDYDHDDHPSLGEDLTSLAHSFGESYPDIRGPEGWSPKEDEVEDDSAS